MDQIQIMPKTIHNILATGKIKLCRRLDKAPSRNPPQKHKKKILTPHIILEMLRLEQQQHKSSKWSICEGVMIWASSETQTRYWMTDRH